jgi:hypothetical protein
VSSSSSSPPVVVSTDNVSYSTYDDLDCPTMYTCNVIVLVATVVIIFSFYLVVVVFDVYDSTSYLQY